MADWGELYTENGQTIFEVESLKFRDYVNAVYKLRDEHPECFGQGAFAVIDSLYNHYKSDFSDRWDLTLEKFRLEATKQFLYLSNDDQQLRIDLFRHISPKTVFNDEVFTGGLYHVFDHFRGLRVSTKSKGDYELQEERLFEIIRDIFFNHAEFKKKRINKQEGHHWGDEYIAEHVYDTPVEFEVDEWLYSKKKWKGIFVLDLAKNLFYLNTLYITKAGKGEIAGR